MSTNAEVTAMSLLFLRLLCCCLWAFLCDTEVSDKKVAKGVFVVS